MPARAHVFRDVCQTFLCIYSMQAQNPQHVTQYTQAGVRSVVASDLDRDIVNLIIYSKNNLNFI